MRLQRRAARVIGHSSLAAAAIVSLFTVASMRPASSGAAILLGIWLLLPYVTLAVILETRSSAHAEVAAGVTALAVATGGVLFLIVVVFIHPDAQGAIAVVLTPIYQVVGTGVLLPVAQGLLAKKERAAAQDDASEGARH